MKRFESKYVVAPSGCHEWRSTLRRDGYGKFWMDGRQAQAHRAAWTIFRGAIPAGKWVLHKCDNRKCVNLDHLYIGDAKQNVKDKNERCSWHGRMTVPFETVQKSRQLYSETEMTQQQIADLLGIKQIQVSRYVRGTQRLNR